MICLLIAKRQNERHTQKQKTKDKRQDKQRLKQTKQATGRQTDRHTDRQDTGRQALQKRGNFFRPSFLFDLSPPSTKRRVKEEKEGSGGEREGAKRRQLKIKQDKARR
jgi:hypothetical protein